MARFVSRALLVSLLAATPLAASNVLVNTTADTDTADADCSLREAIVAANTDAAYNGCVAGTGTSDRILFALTLPATITLASDLPELTESVAIVGPGIDELTIDGVDLYRLVEFDEPTDSDPWLVVSELRLTNGVAGSGVDGGGAIAVGASLDLREVELSSSSCDGFGGGLHLSGVGRVERSRIVGNTAAGVPGGGGIFVTGPGSLELLDSTVAGNSATHEASGGGGLKSQALESLVVRRSTISGNTCGTSGGGIEAVPGFFDQTTYFVEIESSTITLNECNVGNAVDYACGGGVRFAAGLDSTLDVTMRNSVVAENTDALGPTLWHDVAIPSETGFVFGSGGFNLVGQNPGGIDAFPAATPNANGDFVGTSASPLDPELTALAANGGPTPTHLFVVVNPHPLVDQGSCAGELADQRGYGNGTTNLRIVDIPIVANNPSGGDGCDIGAVEAFGVSIAKTIFADGFESGRYLFWSSDVQ